MVSYSVPVFTVVPPGATVPSRISSSRPIVVVIEDATLAQSGLDGSGRIFQSSNVGIVVFARFTLFESYTTTVPFARALTNV